jgi:hypothetical protein
MDTFKESKKLYHLILRVSKADSSFLYFTLESNENLAFYSTLDHKKGCNYRDIDIKCTIELKDELTSVLGHFEKLHPAETLKEEVIPDINT